MSKKDKKIEIQIKDAKVIVNKATIEGFELLVGKKVIESLPLLIKKMYQVSTRKWMMQ